MKLAACLVFVMSFAQITVLGQSTQPAIDEQSKDFLKQLVQDEVYVFIKPEVAEKLLIHKVDPVFINPPMAARVWGTVVVGIEISREGQVLHPMVISGVVSRILCKRLSSVGVLMVGHG